MPVSLNDYPGKIATTVFTAGCNLRCPYCHNSKLIEFSDKNIDKEFFNYIETRKNLIKAVCITGGEPTLKDDLLDFCIESKKRNLSIKLDTNGSNPKVLTKLLNNQLLDYIAMDIKTSFEKYKDFDANENLVSNIKRSINIIKESKINYEFRITVHPKLLTSNEALQIAKAITPVDKLVLQAYKYSEGVLNKEFCGKKPCSPEYLNKISNIMSAYIDNISIRF